MANDIHLSGSGTVAAGVYGKLQISGAAKILDAVECEELRVSGSCKAVADLQTGDGHISGALACAGGLRAAK